MSDDSQTMQHAIKEALDRDLRNLPVPAPYDFRLRRLVLRSTSRYLVSRAIVVVLVSAAGIVSASFLEREGSNPVGTTPTVLVPAGELVFGSQVGIYEEFHRISLPEGSPVAISEPLSSSGLELSPDGTRLAYTLVSGPELGELFVMELSTGEERRIVHDIGTIITPAWGPDGHTIAFSTGSSIYSVRDDGEGLTLRARPAEGAVDVDWSPDGTRLAYSTPDGDVALLDLRIGDSTMVWDHQDGFALGAAWSPDGTVLALHFQENLGVVLVPLDGSASERVTPPGMVALDPTWSSSGDKIFFSGSAAGSQDRDIYMTVVGTSEVTRITGTDMDDGMPSFAAS